MIIRLVRHAESEANAGVIPYNTISDAEIKLTPKGVRQAQLVGQVIGGHFVSDALLYASPYMRTMQTIAALIDGSDAVRNGGIDQVYQDPRLREAEFGTEKGPEKIEVEKEVRDRHGYFWYRYHGGESPADVYDRVSGFIDTMTRQVERKKNPRVLIVSHGITIRCFVMRFMHLTVDEFDSIDNPNNTDIVTIAPTASNLMNEPQFVTGKWGVSGLKFRWP